MSDLDAEDLAGRLPDRTPAGIADRISELIEMKVLPADSRLPTVRDLAQELGVSVGTIAQAWSQLRERGLVETRRRGGTRVLPRPRRRAEDFSGPGSPLKRMGLLISGVSGPDSSSALEAVLRIVVRAEELGFDAACLATGPDPDGIRAPVPVLAAASQRTCRIGLLTQVSDSGWGTAQELPADLETLSLLCRGRLTVARRGQHVVRTALPTDTASPEQERRFNDIAAEEPAGALTGISDDIADELLQDPEYASGGEVLFALPPGLEEADCLHLLAELTTRLGPALGWKPEA